MKKRILSMLLVLALVAALLPGLPVLATEEAPAPLDIQDGLTLHCWNWSFTEIEARMADIAAMGYTAIQTSPIQQAKQATAGYPSNDWWVFYQPANFTIDDSGDSALGTKAEFQSMCAAAHDHGIKVIVDVVANHMGNTETGGNGLATTITLDLSLDNDCWHDITKNTGNYSSRLEVTQYCMAGLPDLNTANPKVQNFVLNYLKECIDAGADGFRFDAAKHIETPDDGDLASDFWPNVINGAEEYAETSRGIDLYCYGELLDSPGGNIGADSYTKYMSITDNSWSNSVLASVVSGGSIYPSYHKGEAEDLVLWAESHDTFADGTTMDVSEENVNKAWAIVAARADAMGLYLARPANMSQLLGAGSLTGWARPEVAAVNKFHNAFVGESEYLGNESGIAYVVRGNSGAVLVNTKGSSADVNISIQNLAAGTYTDILTGNVFTVDLGTVTGTVGDTGIAVLMEGDVCAHASHDAEGLCTACRVLVGHEYDENNTCACGAVKAGERTIYFVNSAGWSTVNFYSWYDDINIFTGAWPGNAMTHVEGNIYSCTVPDDIPNIIFNDGNATQTDDLTVPADMDQFDFATNLWSVYGATDNGCAHSSHNAEGVCDECGITVGHIYGEDATCDCGATDPNRRVVYFTNSANWSTVNFYSWYDGGSEITAKWPGDAMTQVEGNIYSCIMPADAKNIIFNNGASSQTDNLTLSDGMNMFDFASKQWSSYTPEPEPTEPPATDAPATDAPTEAPAPTEPAEPKPATNVGVIVVWVAVGIAAIAVVVALVIRKKK